MSNIFILAASNFNWPNFTAMVLLAISIILWICWIIKVLLNGGPLRGSRPITDRPGLHELVLVLIGLVLFSTLFSWLLQGTWGSNNMESVLADAIGKLLACLLVLGFMEWQNPGRLGNLGLDGKLLGRQFGWGILTGLAVWPVVAILLAPVSLWLVEFITRWGWGLNYSRQQHTLLNELSKSPNIVQSLMIISLAVAVAPITEEIIFRGLFQGALVRLFGSRWPAIAVAAAVFAGLHLSPRANTPPGQVPLAQAEAILPLFLMGLAAGYAYEKSRSIYRPIAIHILFNTLSVVMTLLRFS